MMLMIAHDVSGQFGGKAKIASQQRVTNQFPKMALSAESGVRNTNQRLVTIDSAIAIHCQREHLHVQSFGFETVT